MRVLLADSDKAFVRSILDAWQLPLIVPQAIYSEKDLVAAIKQSPVDMAFIHVRLLSHDGMDVVSFLK